MENKQTLNNSAFGEGEFCPITCSINALEKQIQRMRKNGNEVQARFYEGVRYHRIVCIASGIM